MIDILLSTHNGAAYLPELLESLQKQSWSDFRVWMRDDGSQDASAALLREKAAEDGRFRLVEAEPLHNASRSFWTLLRESRAEYVMFCDQDDRWHENKVEITLETMRSLEARWGGEAPLLVHTDLQVTDAVLRPVSRSMMRSQALHPERCDLPRLLCQSLVSGCTVMINAPLRALAARPLPESCLMYDWWLSLLAAAFGHIGYQPCATIDYRQHGGNTVGARNVFSASYLLSRLGRGAQLREAMEATCRQAAALASIYRDELDESALALVQRYAALPSLGPLERRREALRLGTCKSGLRRLGQLLYM